MQEVKQGMAFAVFGVIADPFGLIRTGCYWYWFSGHISCEGVLRELEIEVCGLWVNRMIGNGGLRPAVTSRFGWTSAGTIW